MIIAEALSSMRAMGKQVHRVWPCSFASPQRLVFEYVVGSTGCESYRFNMV